jgi:two-component system chemotaxis sensor kinase CheA
MQKYLQLYLDECEEEIESLNNALLALESDPFSRDSIHEVFRMAHRIKGSSAAMGFDAVTRLTHEIESIFDDLRSGTRSLDDAILNVLFRCIDGLRDYHLALRAGNHDAIDLATLHAQLIEPPVIDAAATGTAPVDSAADMRFSEDLETEGSAERGPDEESLADSSREPDAPNQVAAIDANEACSDTEGSISIVAITFDPGLSFVDLKAEVIQAKLRTHADILAVDPPIEELPGKNEVAFRLVTTAALAVLGRLADIDGVIRIVLEQRDSSGECVDRLVMENGSTCLATNTSAPPMVASGAESRQAFSPPSPDKVAREALSQPTCAAKTPAREVHAESEVPPAVAAKSTVAVESAGKVASNGAKTAAPAESTGKVAETVRVEIDRLDHLMNLAGELVINKARFVQIANGMQSIFHGKSAQFAARDISDRLGGISKLLADAREQGNGLADVELLLSHFSRLQDDFGTVQETLVRVQEGRQQFTSMAEAIHQLTRVSDGIQKSVMETRMVPVGPLFIRFKRVIRDIARGAGKEVNLVIGGEKTELDKRMIDELGDPLIHMVRNAVDHGLETPQERAAAGKSRSGTIRLDANHRGNSVVITVSDDGRGIDVQRLRQKLVEKNILSEADALQLPDKQVLQYIWFPGFSTAAKVTDISGRGVGMDIVKSKIEELNGTVDVKTEVGVGTTFSIRLPLTLAILPSLLARICGEVYAMPLEAVEEIVKVPVNEIYTIQGKEAIRVRNRVLSLARLDEIFTWPSGALAQRNLDSPPREETVVIVEANDVQVGLVVDSLLGEDDIVIKSLAHNFVNVRGLAGASILGDGRVSLILDVGVLIDMVSQAALRDGAQAARPGRGPQG